MSAQILNGRSTRRIARSTGLDVVRAWGHGGYTMAFVTAEHRHGWWDKKTCEWGWDQGPWHYSSCAGLFDRGLDDVARRMDGLLGGGDE